MCVVMILAVGCGLFVAGTAQAASGTWTQTTSGGLWSAGGNWSGGTVADGSGSTANFNTLDITADNTVHLDTARTIGNLTFGDTATGTAAGWTLDNNSVAGNILTLAGTTPTITVNALGTGKTATISGAIAGTDGLTKAGAGPLTLSGPITCTGNLAVSGGTLTFAAGASGTFTNLSNVTGGGNVVFDMGTGAMTFTPPGENSFLVGSGGAGTLTLKSGTLNSTQRVCNGRSGGSHATYIQTGGTFNGRFSNGEYGDASTTADATISGGLFSCPDLSVSSRGPGTLTVNGTGTVDVSVYISVAYTGSANGTVNLDGGTIIAKEITRDGTSRPGTFNFNGGTLKARATTTTLMHDLTRANVRNVGAIIDTAGFAATISQPLLHSNIGGDNATDGGLTKNGAGTLTLSGANTYSGLTSVLAGTLTLSGSAIGTVTGGLNVAAGATFNPGGPFTVGSGKTLSGAGSVLNSVIASESTINPGDSPGTLTVQGGLTLDSASVLNYQFNGAPGGSNDLIALTTASPRALTLDGTLNISNLGGMTMGQYTLISGATSITDAGLDIGTVPGGYTASQFTVSRDASNVYLNVTASDIPEPATMVLLGAGLAGLLRHARRRIGA